MENHSIINDLNKIGIFVAESLEDFHPRVRDRTDVSVLKCRKSGIILLSSTDHIVSNYYQEKKINPRQIDLARTKRDTDRRKIFLEPYVENKIWLDIGTGAGAILEALKKSCSVAEGIEPQNLMRENLSDLGFGMYASLEESPDNYYDVITLFHVLEHIDSPLSFLSKVHSKLKKDGVIIIEVPHADDFLIKDLNLDAFKDFTFWSEHLILNTRESLNGFLQASNFIHTKVLGVQRYPLSNHLHWLSKGKPGGHQKWAHLNDQSLEKAYEDKLCSLNRTDTLLAIAKK